MPIDRVNLLDAAVFGAGFATVLCIILDLAAWFKAPPKPPAPWMTNRSRAKYSHIDVGEDSHDVFCYSSRNDSDEDYRLDTPEQVESTGRPLRVIWPNARAAQ